MEPGFFFLKGENVRMAVPQAEPRDMGDNQVPKDINLWANWIVAFDFWDFSFFYLFFFNCPQVFYPYS